ncbi:hypothetical protein M1439_03175 [Candidatus Marsarchaeota archaeon]|jgi:hypothetical protein|nr:hypothetical protein [Candidatus Marsarchaeota archaeon]MCL5092570.1 hypothetical protein [Candidatus Marsarchaeota archaeon]
MKKKQSDDKREIEEIKRLKDLEAIIKRSSMENVLISGASKDFENSNNSTADTIINSLSKDKFESKDIALLDRLTQTTAHAHFSKGKYNQSKPRNVKHAAYKSAKAKAVKKGVAHSNAKGKPQKAKNIKSRKRK